MDISKTTVGHDGLNLFIDSIAFNVAELLEESEEVKTANATRKMFFEILTHCDLKVKRPSFDKFKTYLTQFMSFSPDKINVGLNQSKLLTEGVSNGDPKT